MIQKNLYPYTTHICVSNSLQTEINAEHKMYLDNCIIDKYLTGFKKMLSWSRDQKSSLN